MPIESSSPTAASQTDGQKKKGTGGVAIVVIGPGPKLIHHKLLLGREKDSGGLCRVRLTHHGVTAFQFSPGQTLQCLRISEGDYEFAGVAPRNPLAHSAPTQKQHQHHHGTTSHHH